MSFHPPQAYTKETLAKAFDWLQHQPTHVAQSATTPDSLVAIYLKAQRQGISSFNSDAPVSSKKFIDDLRNLKKDLAPFEEEKPTPVRPVITRESSHDTPSPVNVAVAVNVDNSRQNSQNLNLDERSLEAIQQIQERFNLGTPQEALRMLITVGHQHISRWS